MVNAFLFVSHFPDCGLTGRERHAVFGTKSAQFCFFSCYSFAPDGSQPFLKRPETVRKLIGRYNDLTSIDLKKQGNWCV